MSADRPINADVESAPDADDAAAAAPEAPKADRGEAPKAEPAKAEAEKPAPKSKPEPADRPPPAPPRRRKGIPGAIKLVAVLVALAIGFIVLAIVAGSGGSKDKGATETVTTSGAAPVVAAPSEPAQSGGEDGESEGDESAAEAPTASAEELGYPGFATDNTTRVGGADPATIAAASALAVFPSTTDKQRPAAVTLVDEDPAFAIPAAVMMAAPVRAPILFYSGDELPAVSAAALETLGPQGSPATGGHRVLAMAGKGDLGFSLPGDVAYSGTTSARPQFDGAVAGIARLREEVAGEPPDAYILAPLREPEIAAPAAAWAARSGDPVLDAEGKELPPNTAELLKAHAKIPVFVLGPKSSVPEAVLGEVKKIGNPVKRVAGKDPVATALAFARYGSGKFGWDVNDPGHGFVLARAQEPLAAAAASALSASGTWGPLLLTDSAATLPGEVREYFLDVKPGYTTDPTRAFYNHVWVIGDQEAIDVKQQAEVNELAELAKIGEGSEG